MNRAVLTFIGFGEDLSVNIENIIQLIFYLKLTQLKINPLINKRVVMRFESQIIFETANYY